MENRQLKYLECFCVKRADASLSSTATINSKLNADANLRAVVSATASITSLSTKVVTLSATAETTATISAKLSARMSLDTEQFTGDADIHKSDITADYNTGQVLENIGDIVLPTNLEKIAGDFGNYTQVQKLYPIEDLSTTLTMGKFVGPYNQSGNLYSFIDEGIFAGKYDESNSDSYLTADDTDYIQPNTFHTEGEFQYKAKLSNLLVKPEETRFRLRASAPLRNYESRIPPVYTVHNIKLSDPSGNLIVEYNDIVFKGDADQHDNPTANFTTFSSAPKLNNATKFYEWQDGYPVMHEKEGYTISFDVKVESLDDAFTEGFDAGFEEDYIIHDTYASGSDYLALDGAPLSTQNQTLINPTKNIRISAFEISNSGAFPFGEGYGPRYENYLALYTEVPTKGKRIEKKIIPTFMPLADFDTGVWPSVSSIWIPNDLDTASNQDKCGSEHIVHNLSDGLDLTYATLNTIGPHLDSGKLTLRFGHGPTVGEITEGAFHSAFDQSIANSWYEPSGAFNTRNRTAVEKEDHGYFVVDSVTLKVRAKKAVDTRDFVLDVVGYSDDKLLNVTKAPSGFLQNPSGVQVNNIILASEGVHPYVSGFYDSSDDFALGGQSISEKDNHYEASGNYGGDHYSLSTYPTVTSTEFADYEVPLKIFDDDVKLGRSRNYTVSSLFENLYLDIYPLPSGASIADIHLLVQIKPQDAFQLSIEGGEDIGRRSQKLFTSAMTTTNDIILNAGSGYGPLSNISNVPHGYDSPDNVKTNYARRWKGMQGLVETAYNVNEFAFGFSETHVDFPFTQGYYTFDKEINQEYISRDVGSASGLNVTLSNGTIGSHTHKNLGWRFASGTLFQDQLGGWTTSYQTADWTSYTNGGSNFTSNALYGKIADAFDSIVKVSGQTGGRYIDVQSTGAQGIDTSGGFSMFLRFIPDVDATFNSGVLASKWNTGNDLDFVLGYENGYLTAHAKDDTNNIITVQDTTLYSEYQYPLSVLLTYNDHNSKKLKLYTDHESYQGDWNILRGSSASFDKFQRDTTDQAGIQIGWSAGSGIGMQMMVSEFGLSSYTSGVYGSGTNIVEVNADRSFNQVTAEEFLSSQRAKFFDPNESYENDSYELWDYVNEDTALDWNLGDFRDCEFTFAFSSLGSAVGKRSGRDLVDFHIVHHGSGYIQNANYAMPTNVDSGVAYHTQVENDFLRFHLSDTDDHFYSTHRRITKSLPRGYKFTEDAIVVDTIIEHSSDNEISWGDCLPTRGLVCREGLHSYEGHTGPKVIVSLYTKRQEPRWSTDEVNWGLINRDVHYLAPSSCIIKLESKFDYDSLTDESEQWALFPNEPRYKEFGERYFSNDVDDMFLQYDIVYPSGPAFESSIKIHSAHVRLEDANVNYRDSIGNMNIFASGGNVLNNNGQLPPLTLSVSGNHLEVHESGFNLSTYGSYVPWSGLNLYTSGTLNSSNSFNLYSQAQGTIRESGLTLMTSGATPEMASGSLALVIPKVKDTVDSSYNPPGMSLYLFNGETAFLPSGGYLNLFTYAVSGDWTGVRAVCPPMFISGVGQSGPSELTPSLNLNILGTSIPENRFPSASTTLFIDAPLSIPAQMPLFIPNIVNTIGTSVGDQVDEGGLGVLGVNLFLANYGGVGSDYVMWYNNNYGTTISQSDNVYASVPVGNEIRGVDLIGYGSCTGNSPRKAIQPAVITDGTEWVPEACYEGGIFRAIGTYTNPTASGFGDTVGYNNNYYGIRKFFGLVPNAPYNLTMDIVTGATYPIKVPRDMTEWEYGHCGPEHFLDSGCCPQECNSSIVYSGGKLIGDYPYLNNDAESTPPSGRNTGDQYGKTVRVAGDLMAVSAPRTHVPYIDPDTGNEAQIDDAGAVFLYRRGEDVPGMKAAWQMEDKLMLPSGFRKDFISREFAEMVRFDQFVVSGRQWAIGQEGREFGHSLDVCSSGDRETLVIGAPFAKWTREFDNIETSGIPVAMMVFTDAFNYDKKKMEQIAGAARKWDVLYKYFSAPWYAGTDYEFQPQLRTKLFIFQVMNSNQDQPPVNHDNDWFKHIYLPRMDDKTVTGQDGVQATYDAMLSGVTNAFLSTFQQDAEPHSGIPPILGVFREKSASAGLGAFYNPLNAHNIVDDFIDFYEKHAYASGVVDPETGISESGYYNKILAPSEDWGQVSIDLLNKTLNSGNLIEQDALKYVTSGVGQEWAQENAYDFQLPPSSGGRVYVFEKESGIFNCVQEILSFSDRATTQEDDLVFGYGMQYNDRYGHTVSISKNSDTIAIGSPFTHTPCEIFQRDETENSKMYGKVRDFLVSIGDTDATSKYDLVLAESGADIANRIGYHDMTQDNKLRIRLKYDIQLYKPIYNYRYSDIASTGTWKFIPNHFAGTSRLGYSSAVNDDGTIVAFGAPTDSTTLFEDTNVWYKAEDTWASYTNAGAVRVFESRKIYPHSGVVEFTRFGNLDRSFHPNERDQGFYDQMGLYFGVGDNPRPFRRTEFEEIEIPRDAGLAFIITPELDSDSDEVIENIKNWLALGDRTLVLVGNDPIYEENGLYKRSNNIVNRVLKKLGSRMTIVPAADEYQSLPDCVSSEDVFNDRWNVTKAFRPEYNHTKTYPSPITTSNIFAKGVGDIRMNLEDTEIVGIESKNFIEFSPCDKENPEVCALPLKHLGDLRSEWKETCIKTAGDRAIKVEYQKNWAWHFANPNPAQVCDDYPVSPRPVLNRPYEDIVPVLTAAEWLPDTVKIIPARSGVNEYKDYCFEDVFVPKPPTVKKTFAKVQDDWNSFSILEDSDSEFSGIFTEYDFGTFFDPDAKNDRDPILQATGYQYEGKPITKSRTLLPDSILALQEAHHVLNQNGDRVPTNSNVIIMASLLGENERSFGATGDVDTPSNNDDENVFFYVNMIINECDATAKVAQLGGWTGRESFKDAYSSDDDVKDTNIIKERLESYDIQVQENLVITDETQLFEEQDPVTGNILTTLWIANPIGKPDDTQVGKILEFLSRGQKKVVITYAGNDYNTHQQIADNVAYICEKLNIYSRPCFIPSIGEYFVQGSSSVEQGNQESYPYSDGMESTQRISSTSIPTEGCDDGYDFYDPHRLEPFDTKVGKFALWPHNYETGGSSAGDGPGLQPTDYIPISGGGTFNRIIWYRDPIRDTETFPVDLFKIDARSTITFPAVKGSGYRLFVDWVSETNNDFHEINATFKPVSFNPYYPEGEGDGDGREGFMRVQNTARLTPKKDYIDFIATEEEITVTFTSNHTAIRPEDELAAGRGLPPATPRILSVSGCPLPIEESIVTGGGYFEKRPCNPPFTITYEYWYEPEQRIVIPGEFRPIKHLSDPYCNPFAPSCDEDSESCCDPRGEALIEDGPVIVAEEFEHFSAGRNGARRSKIVVISDSTIIQGQCPQYRSDSVGENQAFIRSLYPTSSDRGGDQALGREIQDLIDGNKFEFAQKLRAPERGSAAKYYAVSGINNTTDPLYGGAGSFGSLDNYTDGEDNYLPANPGFVREKDPIGAERIKQEIVNFGQHALSTYGVYPRFSGDFLNLGSYDLGGEFPQTYILDAGVGGGLSDLMKLTGGKDYLDFEYYTSGCVGDLFGYSIDMTQDKLVVGTPFNAYNTFTAVSGVSGIVQWHEIQNGPDFSGIDLCEHGGAGAAFYFERTGSGTNIRDEFLPWEFVEKIKPSSINTGMINPSIGQLYNFGDHNLDASFIETYGSRSDQFGYSVAIDDDVIAVGAPNHDFATLHDHSIYHSGEFIRKEFGIEFMIPQHVAHDLGSSGVRGDQFANASGNLVLNNGAVFTYKYKIDDWQALTKSWSYVEKLYAQGHKDRTAANKYFASIASGCENDHFGWSVDVNRAKRGDSDYTLVGGAPFHDFATSGNHPSSATDATPENGLDSAGSAYTFDGMLREQNPSIPNSGGWIEAAVFGHKADVLRTRVYQPTLGDPVRVTVSGLVFANEQGSIFLEGSGFDASERGFIPHRPYVESVIGKKTTGEQERNWMNLNVFGRPNSIDNAWPWLVGGEEFSTDFAYDMDSLVHRPSGMSLFIPGPSSAYVYNNIALPINISGTLGVNSGDMPLFTMATNLTESLNINISGEDPNKSGILNLNVRGR